jgi:Tfp pilus assembly protein PilP
MKKRIKDMREIRIPYIVCGIALVLILWPFSAGTVYSAETEKGIKPPAAAPATSNYNYRWLGRNDPFRPFMDTEAKPKKKVEPATRTASGLPISPLQRLDLGIIKVVGIAGDENQRKAVIEDTQKRFYPVQVGTHIGTNNGVIREILADRIIVEEKTTVNGRMKVNLVTIKLHTSEDEGRP